MTRVVLRVLAVQVVLWVGVPGAARAQQPHACVSAVPANVQAGILTDEFIALVQASPTFRAQCERIGAAPSLRVEVELVPSLGTARAETAITRYEAGSVRAKVRIAFGRDYSELIAHEFEHVIEQLDGVNLRVETERGRAWLVDAQVFETLRASEVGRRVRRECELSGSHAAPAHHDLR